MGSRLLVAVRSRFAEDNPQVESQAGVGSLVVEDSRVVEDNRQEDIPAVEDNRQEDSPAVEDSLAVEDNLVVEDSRVVEDSPQADNQAVADSPAVEDTRQGDSPAAAVDSQVVEEGNLAVAEDNKRAVVAAHRRTSSRTGRRMCFPG